MFGFEQIKDHIHVRKSKLNFVAARTARCRCILLSSFLTWVLSFKLYQMSVMSGMSS